MCRLNPLLEFQYVFTVKFFTRARYYNFSKGIKRHLLLSKNNNSNNNNNNNNKSSNNNNSNNNVNKNNNY